MDVLASLTDDFLEEHFAPETIERALGYLDRLDGPPTLQRLSEGSVTATAFVHGSAPTAYHVQLHCEVGRPSGRSRSHTRGWIFSLCTCPVRNMCKHGAAVALSIREGHTTGERVPEWERRLGTLVEDLARTADREVERFPLALQVTLDERRIHSYRDGGGPTVGLRPLRPGAKQAWIKSGADWSDIPGAVLARSLLPEQADAIGALHTELTRHRGYHAPGTIPTLAQFGPHLPRLLRAAEAAGVELLPAAPLTEVTVLEKPVGLAAEVTSDGEQARLTLGVDLDGELWRGDRVLLTDHNRVVALLDGGRLRIADLERDVPTVARRLIEDDPLEVPVGELDALRGRLAALLRHLAIRSPDGSVDVPAPVRPTLLVTVVWRSATAADLTWEWRYDDAHRCGLDARDLLDGLRDRSAEATIRATVSTDLLGRRSVRDGDALSLAIHDLPHLRELPDVAVVEDQRPDFREAVSAPEITFEVLEPDEEADDGRTDWLDLAVTVSVEGERIPLPDVLAALTLDREFLVLPSGLFITTDRPEFDRLREVVAAAAELRERDGDRIGVGTHDLGLWAQLAETGIVDAQAGEWVARARALRDLVEIPRPEPVGLTTRLRSYQREGFWWLAFLWEHGLGGILADDMGLGKTLQVLALVRHARERRPDDGPFLVVAPTSVVTAWAHEAAQHAPDLRIGVCGRRTDDVAAIAAESDLVVTTYTVLRLAHARYAEVDWGGLVLDEAQQVKNHQSKTYAAVRTVDAPFKLAVTGTPFENRLMELWALLSITVPGLYPWPRLFNERVARPVERGGDQQALARFRARIRPFLLRRTKELVAADLPPKQEQVLDVALEPRHRKIYDTHLAKERQRILGLVEDFDRNRVAIFSALTTLRQLALDPGLVDPAHDAVGSAKLDLLVDHLEEITAEGHRALVFSQFTSFLGRVRDRLAAEDIGATYLDGSTRDRAGVIEEFRSGGAPVFLISLKAGGVGLTLTEADYVFVLDPWWNPAAEAQAVDRAHRIGQTAHVHVYRLVATDTIEEKVMELKGRKAELFAQVIDGEGAMSLGIDADDIRGLFDE